MVIYVPRAPASIETIPVETLDNILVLAVNMEKATAAANGLCPFSWMKIGNVCRRWRKVVEMRKALWDDVVAINPDLTALFLERAARPSIRVALIRQDKEEWNSHLFKVLRDFSNKIILLDMKMPSAMWEGICNGEKWQMNRPERLQLSTYEVEDIVSPSAILPFDTPVLQKLDLRRFHLTTTQPLMSTSKNLEHSEVCGALPIPANDVWATLLTIPALKHLTLCATVMDDSTRHEVSLPLLQRLEMPIRSRVSVGVFTHLNFPLEASILLEVECEELDDVKAVIKIIAPKFNSVVREKKYQRCKLYHENTSYTRISFSPAAKEHEADRASAKQKLDLVLASYLGEEDGQVYDGLAEDLHLALSHVTHLEIEDMASYNAVGLPPSRDLIGPFPSRILRVLTNPGH
ncbi:hypothetical protein NEOLEDRAFT_1243307 [Neolentinus lepideus HHB14362 ss-1]|uniref:F-box domain-containing protein n=1 Tax=Neolentinus lepideus HHB14362 ss-1 TaxID=1314782 RepID=A0A165R4W4_9AGAM|nr:hypothetical protein NEOLEDRAFT_1243307 [Neolentinus lepideus HHB14362 ss-1]